MYDISSLRVKALFLTFITVYTASLAPSTVQLWTASNAQNPQDAY